ncbi:MAG: class I SAM-dependent methyltransferase [Candidatus Cloacimonas sp.]|jgi:SAM-dependent methyltransferase|nr:class I SAM-dependent methyltransferase [Candidatus Cloacimonas sp.]
MEYDPIKDRIAAAITLFPTLRKGMYKALDLLLLRQRYVKREISHYFRKQESFRFYDAGAGFCQYSWFVLNNWQNAKVFATDLKTDYLKSFAAFAKAETPGRFSYQSADLQEFTPQNKYQLCIAIDILEHIEDDQSALKHFHTALDSEGILIISTPSDTDEAAKFTSEHVRPGYAKAELEAKLHEAGFELVKSIYTYGMFGSLAWRLLMKYPLQMVNKAFLPLMLPYYLFVYPISAILMQLDLHMDNKSGTGILVVAQKPR